MSIDKAAPFQGEGDIDHDQTSNRTHNGDDLTPNSVDTNDLIDGAGTSHTGELADLADLAAYVTGQSNDMREEHGEKSLDPGSSSTDDWSDTAKATSSLTFGTSFASTPVVFAQGNDIRVIFRANNRSTTGFDFRVDNYTTDDPGARDGWWLALGSD